MVKIHGVKASICTVEFRPNERYMFDTWMPPKQRHICVQMNGVDTYKCMQIQIYGESPLIWSVQINVQTPLIGHPKTLFGLWSLYVLL